MKFKFKIQQYQTDAVEATVNVFAGQPSKTSAQYRRDLGKTKGRIVFDEEYVGYKNTDVELQGSQLLANIQQQQAIYNIPKSLRLSQPDVWLCPASLFVRVLPRALRCWQSISKSTMVNRLYLLYIIVVT